MLIAQVGEVNEVLPSFDRFGLTTPFQVFVARHGIPNSQRVGEILKQDRAKRALMFAQNGELARDRLERRLIHCEVGNGLEPAAQGLPLPR